MQEDSNERTKFQKHKKCKRAWEWGTNEYFCLPYVTILWCPSWKLPEDRGKKMKLIFLASKELCWIWNLGFHFPKLDYHQWLKVHTFAIWKIQTSRRIQHVGFIVKWSVTLGRNCPEIWVHQVVANCCSCNCFPKFFKILDPPLILSCQGSLRLLNFVVFCYKFDLVRLN